MTTLRPLAGPALFDRNRSVLALNDPVLHGLLCAVDEEERRRELGELIVLRARPIIDRVLARQLQTHRGIPADSVEDIAATVVLRLMVRLETMQRSAVHAIREFDDYVATAAMHAGHDFVRRRYPERTRLEMRLRYALTRDPRLAMWSAMHSSLCGLASWADRTSVSPGVDLQRAAAQRSIGDRDHPADALVALFGQVAMPLMFATVVETFAELWRVEDGRAGESFEALVEQNDGAASLLHTHELVQIVWEEISALPPRQRSALLLNLRDGSGRNALALFPLTNVAGFADLAQAVGLSHEALSDVWADLPLDDLKVASMFGISRQQVINLRKSARERLRRRLATRQRRSGQ